MNNEELDESLNPNTEPHEETAHEEATGMCIGCAKDYEFCVCKAWRYEW